MGEGDRRYYKRAPDLRLISVPHTGTVFTRYVLGLMGLTDHRNDGVGYLSHHTYEFDGPWLVLPETARIIVPLRDPMLAECSRINRGFGADISDWDHITPLDAHFFRVQQPEGVSRADAVVGLAGFLGKPAPDVDWTPKNARPDRRNVKSAYARGEITSELRPAWDWLRQSEPTKALFRAQGYNLPWMED